MKKTGKFLLCAVCNKTFWRKPSHIKNNNFCSKKHANLYSGLRHIGDKHPNWKGGIWITSGGYRAISHFLIEDEVKSLLPYSKESVIGEHDYIWIKYNKKRIPCDCVVHHKDKNRLNNDIANLCMMLRSEHMKLHHQERKNNYKLTKTT